MTPRTAQCEVFWALLLSSEHSGVPEDSKSPTLEVLGFTPTLGQNGVVTMATCRIFLRTFDWKFKLKNSKEFERILALDQQKLVHQWWEECLQ
jgi:hypothetical protein